MEKEFAKEYATALFDLLLDNNKVDQTIKEIEAVALTVSSDLELVKFLTHPTISKDEKKSFVKDIFSEVDKTVLYFLFVLVDNGRLQEIKYIYESYINLYNDYNKILDVKAITTTELSNEQLQKLMDKLSKKYRKKIQINNVIDQSIVGGMRLIINDEVIDNTINNQLRNLKSYVLKEN